MRPRPEDVPARWRRGPRAELRDVATLDELPELESRALRLARLVRRLTHSDLKACWAGRQLFLDRTGWHHATLDRSRGLLQEAGLLDERRRPGDSTLRRLNPSRVAELAERARARRGGESSTQATQQPTPEATQATKQPTTQATDEPTPQATKQPTTQATQQPTRLEGRDADRKEGQAGSGRQPGPPPSTTASAGSSTDGKAAPDAERAPPEGEEGEPAPGDGRSAARGGNGATPAPWSRRVGEHPDTGRPVIVGRNEHGAYVAHLHPGDRSKATFVDVDAALLGADARLRELSLEEVLLVLEKGKGLRGVLDWGASPGLEEDLRQIEAHVPVIRDTPGADEGGGHG